MPRVTENIRWFEMALTDNTVHWAIQYLHYIIILLFCCYSLCSINLFWVLKSDYWEYVYYKLRLSFLLQFLSQEHLTKLEIYEILQDK